jgi:hypothetical protein
MLPLKATIEAGGYEIMCRMNDFFPSGLAWRLDSMGRIPLGLGYGMVHYVAGVRLILGLIIHHDEQRV